MTTKNDPTPLDAGGVSRREFFVGAGATAGALAAIGSVAGLTHSTAAEAALARKYYSYSVALELDGNYAGQVMAAEGGEPVLTPRSRLTGQPATVRYEPLSMRLADMSKAMYDWIAGSANGSGIARTVSVIAANQDLSVSYRLDLQNARLTEILLDSLDASSLEPVRFNVKVAPASSTHQFGGGGKTSVKPLSVKATPLLRMNYLLYIQGLDAMAARVRSVETVGFRMGENGVLVPQPLKFEIALRDAAPLYQWMNDTIAGKGSTPPGELQLLTKDRTKVASSVSFEQLTVTRVGYPTQSTGDSIQTVEVECTPAAARFNLGELLT